MDEDEGRRRRFDAATVVVRPDTDLPRAVGPRIAQLLRRSGCSPVEIAPGFVADTPVPPNHLVIDIGDPALQHEAAATLGPEAFIVRSSDLPSGSMRVSIAGNPFVEVLRPDSGRTPHEWTHGNRGLAYGAYAALEELGFAFLHPLAPSVPPTIRPPSRPIALREAPHWEQFRGIHYHTQHPLELTPFLQGFGDTSHDDRPGWERHIPEWESYGEWLLANRQNGIEWALLEDRKWDNFERSDERIERIKTIVDVMHGYGIMVGVDVPIVFAQQHSFRLLRSGVHGKRSIADDDVREIQESLDWVMRAGFDFLGTESGTSEFTKIEPAHMLALMNCASDHAASKHNVPMHVKVHCSSGQVAKGYVDDRTGEDINYNMLPHFASPTLGVLPHTVEVFSLDDPSPTYGNVDFSYMRDYLNWEVEQNKRSVIFYPETAYWVSVDIDTPLFLPVYGYRRVHDLRLLADDQKDKLHRMDGQMIFSSGWEWGYFLNDVVTARAAWNPRTEHATSADAYVASLEPLVRHLDPVTRKAFEDVMRDWVVRGHETLVLGQVNGVLPETTSKRNGLGYLAGWDTWDDVSRMLGKLTQPDRMSIEEVKSGETVIHQIATMFGHRHEAIDIPADYHTHVRPLLIEMDELFTSLAQRTEAIVNGGNVPEYLRDVFDDLVDSGWMTALRAKQIRNLYEYADSVRQGTTFFSRGPGDPELAAFAMEALRSAETVVARREPRYRVEVERVAGWTGLNTTNPTAYAFNYLWTVHSLHLWWRDAAKALINSSCVRGPSFCNIIDPLEVGLGEGPVLETAEKIAALLTSLNIGKNYFDLAEKEPQYPRDIPGWDKLPRELQGLPPEFEDADTEPVVLRRPRRKGMVGFFLDRIRRAPFFTFTSEDGPAVVSATRNFGGDRIITTLHSYDKNQFPDSLFTPLSDNHVDMEVFFDCLEHVESTGQDAILTVVKELKDHGVAVPVAAAANEKSNLSAIRNSMNWFTRKVESDVRSKVEQRTFSVGQ